ncbi:MAG TPA: hypothetical protein VGT24_02195 [Candidatus Acidoferrales bacterium]|nr:hypothetical protein [Candidatus Acidoferrales bacterium]
MSRPHGAPAASAPRASGILKEGKRILKFAVVTRKAAVGRSFAA